MQGKVSLVTGGASGLGKATVHLLAKQGSRVAILDLQTSNGKKVALELGPNVIFTPADVTSEPDIRDALKTIKQKFGRLDVVVNCAGIGTGALVYDFQAKTPHPLDTFVQTLNVNLVGTFNVIRLSAGLLADNEPFEGQRGVIINTGSILGLEGGKNHIAYAASKAAVMGITLPLAREFGDRGIRVCAISPGHMDTPMHGNLPPHRHEVLVKDACSAPFPKRLGKPSEFALLVQTIVENQMLNGTVIRLDAGLRHNPV